MNQSTLTNNNQTNDEPALLPGLPNHLAHLILSTVRPSLLSAVCRQWRRLIYTPYFPPFLSLYAIVANNNNTITFFTFDPISSKWTTLPPPVTHPPLRFLYRHPAFISRRLTIQSLTVSGWLVVIAATDCNFQPALTRPVVFDPMTGEWFLGPPLANPRRWCAAGCVGDTLYVASGVGGSYRGDVAKMAQKWIVKTPKACNKIDNLRNEWRWEEVAGLKDGRFSRESVDAIGYKEKLYMVNVKGNAGKEGIVYNIKENRWEKMANGMLSGWNGAVGVASEVAVATEEMMYAVDENYGGVRKYDDKNDCWDEVLKGSDLLKGAEQMAVHGGKICVVSGDGGRITVVDVVAQPVKMWVVDPPWPGSDVISIHILGRPCRRV